jgi:tetratricopeptide (TPR) repeat protein
MRVALSFLLVAAAAGSVMADAKKEAKVHLDKAGIAHKEGRYDDARKELEIAYTLDPNPALLYAIGQVHVMQGQCPQAITFYERFIASKPSEAQAKKAQEAIDTCKKLQAEKPPEDTKPVVIEKPPEKIIVEKPVTVVTTTKPWYTDVVGDVLVGLGLGAGVAGAIFYRGALSDRDAADRVMSYEQYDQLIEDSDKKQRIAIVLSASAGALILGGVVSYIVRDRTVETRTVAITPTQQGGIVTWSGRF